MAYFSIASCIGVNSKSPSALTPPPKTRISGLNRCSSVTIPKPTIQPARLTIESASASPCCAALPTVLPVQSARSPPHSSVMHRLLACLDALARLPRQRRTRRLFFQRRDLVADDQDHVSGFRRQAILAQQQPPIADHAAADAGADGDEDHVAIAARRAARRLRQRRNVGIVAQNTSASRTPSAESRPAARYASRSDSAARPASPLFGLTGPGAEMPIPAICRVGVIGQNLMHQRLHALHRRVKSLFRVGRDFLPLDDIQGVIEQRRAHPRAAEINPDNVLGHTSPLSCLAIGRPPCCLLE